MNIDIVVCRLRSFGGAENPEVFVDFWRGPSRISNVSWKLIGKQIIFFQLFNFRTKSIITAKLDLSKKVLFVSWNNLTSPQKALSKRIEEWVRKTFLIMHTPICWRLCFASDCKNFVCKGCRERQRSATKIKKSLALCLLFKNRNSPLIWNLRVDSNVSGIIAILGLCWFKMFWIRYQCCFVNFSKIWLSSF